MYHAHVVQLKNVRVHPNADKLALATCFLDPKETDNKAGYQVVVGLDAQEGQIGIFFPTDGQLSEEFCQVNDLISRIDENGNRAGGFFDHKRRVRVQKFRGEKSEGFFCTHDYLKYALNTPTFEFPVGTKFTEINGHPICNRYETEVTKAAKAQAQKQSKPANPNFPKHVDTDQLRNEWNHIPKGSTLYVSEKLEGTSDRQGFVLIEKALHAFQKFINRFIKIFKPVWEYGPIQGTRNTVIGAGVKDFYNDFNFRTAVNITEKLHKDELIYGEIVGYTSTGKLIMPAPDTTKCSDKNIAKTYGKKMRYTYGCNENEQKLYIYRIAKSVEGKAVDLPYNQMVERAKELGVPVVPLLATIDSYDPEVHDILDTCKWLSEGSSLLDDRHIREGVVVRVETPDGRIYFLKDKSFTYKELAGIIKDQNVVDIEEAS